MRARRRIVRSAIAEAIAELSWSNDDLDSEIPESEWIRWDDYLDGSVPSEHLVVGFVEGIRLR